MKIINKNINQNLHYISILEDTFSDNRTICELCGDIKEMLLTFKEKLFRYRARIGRLKNEVSRLNKIIGELNGSSS